MLVTRRRRRAAARLTLAALAGLGVAFPITAPAQGQPAPSASAPALPARLSDEAFWRMVAEFSEPSGFFRSDNFVSNETAFQHVLPELTRIAAPGGVYLGVGPDQNFTYLVALQPRIAFIVDIRRQNMLQHLLYKALMEQSADRADFLSRLFSRPRPPGLDRGATAAALFQAYDSVPADSALFRKNLAAVTDHLVKRHRFALSGEDLKSIEYVYSAFYAGGPDLTYSSFPGYTAVRTTGSDSVMQELRARTGGSVTVFRMQAGMRRMPTYAELMMETDQQGEQRSYLATEEHYARLREMQRNNLIVPLVGDFGGDRALQAVGSYLRARRATVTAFYTSNVEQYLFQQPDSWRNFFANVSTLPIDDSSVFIRAVFNGIAWRDQGVARTPGPRSVTLLSSISETLQAVNDGRVQTYYDVIQLSR